MCVLFELFYATSCVNVDGKCFIVADTIYIYKLDQESANEPKQRTLTSKKLRTVMTRLFEILLRIFQPEFVC